MRKRNTMTIGCDLGDKFSELCVLDERGEIVDRGRIRTTEAGFRAGFKKYAGCRVVIEVGAHSRWVDELLRGLQCDVIVANARQVKLIFSGRKKSDVADAEVLARLGRADVRLLAPVKHRGRSARRDLAVIRARDALVRSRTKVINAIRGIYKAFGYRVPSCTSEGLPKRLEGAVPEELQAALLPLVETCDELTIRVRGYDKVIEELARTAYPETERLTQLTGVGSLTGLAYVLTIEDPRRFAKSRDVPSYVGLVPKKDQSGAIDRQCRITKAGNPYLRRLLVQSAHYILGPFGPDTDLRRWGHKLAERGGKSAKKRAVVAVARKLTVLLHRLWVTGEDYVPLGYHQPRAVAA